MNAAVSMQDRVKRDIAVLAGFVSIYCRENHDGEKLPFAPGKLLSPLFDGADITVCDDCSRLLLHGAVKRSMCPLDPKPSCKKCVTHCYAPGYRDKIREVMRFSGMYLIRHGRLDLLKKYYF